MLTDNIALLLYKEIIVPWEKVLKDTTGCWDIKQTRFEIESLHIQMKIVTAGQVTTVAESLRRSGVKNFVVFVGASSQAKDLFRHLRNCAAHAAFNVIKKRAKPSTLSFQGIGFRTTQAVIEGQIDVELLAPLIKSLVVK